MLVVFRRSAAIDPDVDLDRAAMDRLAHGRLDQRLERRRSPRCVRTVSLKKRLLMVRISTVTARPSCWQCDSPKPVMLCNKARLPK